jgi:hypothetical protein
MDATGGVAVGAASAAVRHVGRRVRDGMTDSRVTPDARWRQGPCHASSSRRCRWSRSLLGLLAVLSAAGCSGEVAGSKASAGQRREAPAVPALTAGDSRKWPALRIEVVDIARVAVHVIEVRLALVNRAPDQAFDIGDRFAAAAGETGSISGTFLTDPEGTVKYFVLRNAEGRPLCSTGLARLGPGERKEVWARFAVPAERVTSVRVHVPHVTLPGEVRVPDPGMGAD